MNRIIKWLNSRCWHEWEYLSSFDRKMQNDYERQVKIENQKCKKCGSIRQQSFWKDLYITN